ncbi:MAG: serine hydrolase [bacterium]|jgi:CubicO group peptidase (beta-lactamase class C family)
MRTLTLAMLVLLLSAQAAAAYAIEADPLEEVFSFLEDNNLFNGVALVANGGEVVGERTIGYANFEWGIPNTLDTRFRIGSISKQFTAVLALMLVEEGMLSLSDPVGKYIPEIGRPWAGSVTIHHMLCQTSGIPNYTLLEGYLDNIDKKRFTRDEFLDLLVADPLMDSLHFEPGSDFDYSNTNYFLTGTVIERIAGRPFEEVLQEKILGALKMNDTGAFDDLRLVRHRAYGYEKAPDDTYEPTMHSSASPKSVPSGGLYSTAADLLKWHRALQENMLLDEDMMAEFLKAHHKFSETEGYAYANYWTRYALDEAESLDVYEHGGSSFGTTGMFYRVPEADICVILLANGGIGREMFLSSIAYAIIDILQGKQPTLPRCDLLGTIGYTAMARTPDDVREHYAFLKANRRDAYEFGPEQLSMVGQVMLMLFEDRETAELVFKMNTEEFPEEASVWVDLGTLNLNYGDPAQALEYFEKAQALEPEDEAIAGLLERAEEELRGGTSH